MGAFGLTVHEVVLLLQSMPDNLAHFVLTGRGLQAQERPQRVSFWAEHLESSSLASLSACQAQACQLTKQIGAIRIRPFTLSSPLLLSKFTFQRRGKQFLRGKTRFAAYSRNLQNCTGSQPDAGCCSGKCSCLAAYGREMTRATVPTVWKEAVILATWLLFLGQHATIANSNPAVCVLECPWIASPTSAVSSIWPSKQLWLRISPQGHLSGNRQKQDG